MCPNACSASAYAVTCMYMFSTVLTVTIDYAYTSPADFKQPTTNDFRAVSGPVVLTCLVEEATVSVSYLWTSTCSGCFARGTTQSVIGNFLRVHVDQGTHTCTATASDGRTGSADFLMRIIGTFLSSLLCITSSGLHSLPLLQVLGCMCLSTLGPAYPMVP